MYASALGPAALWALSMVPLLPGLESATSGPSRFVLAASPWLFGAGIPRSAGPRDTHAVTAGLVFAALALPPLALALRVDAFDERLPPMSIAHVLGVAVFVFVLAVAAQRAACSVPAQRAHAIAWCALVALGPVLRRVWSHGAHHPAPRWLSAWASASPLEWLWQGGGETARVLWPAVTCAVVLALAFRAPVSRAAHPEAVR
ncbi:MAG: hypothetical protein ACKVWV_13275 [Planctomycetota bacterium]